jgi:hypothetical protein
MTVDRLLARAPLHEVIAGEEGREGVVIQSQECNCGKERYPPNNLEPCLSNFVEALAVGEGAS